MSDAPPIRVGILGAAHIVKGALLTPARSVSDVAVTTLAARDSERARRYAAHHGIPTVRASYEELLGDEEVDAVYIALPAALHERWMLAAIDAGKHVLCEKPFTSNAVAARRVAERARASGSIVMEAYHSRYHPLYARIRRILESDEIGRPRTASAHFFAAIPPGPDIRWTYALGGGGLLDIGYYPLRMLRDLVGEVESVDRAKAYGDEVDRAMSVSLTLAGGVRADMRCAMWSRRLMGMGFAVQGTTGAMTVSFPFHPHLGARVRVRTASGKREERTDRAHSTYRHQLVAFADAVRSGAPVATGADAAATHLDWVDSIYEAAGFTKRPSIGVDSSRSP